MKVVVIGTGYVGLVVGACLAETGNTVCCIDVDSNKIAGLRAGRLPIYEPGLEEIVRRNQRDGRLRFASDVAEGTEDAEVVFLAVGTPPGEDGSADLQYVLDAARSVAAHLRREAVIITKSTVPVGTAVRVAAVISEVASCAFHMASNPEFLKEGDAVEDFLRPDRVVIGVESDFARGVLTELYAPFVRTGKPILFMDLASAEITKYAANAMLATRISFMNEMALLCDLVGANIDSVRRGVGSDSRIGGSFLFPGPGYGGSCFPKDVKALLQTANTHGLTMHVVSGAERANDRQRVTLFERLKNALHGVAERRIAVWGLTFKAQTDDVRESPALALVDSLVAAGAIVVVHDPVAMPHVEAMYGDRIKFSQTSYGAAADADALVIATDWNEYRHPDFTRLRAALREDAVVVDGRNLYDPVQMRRLGFRYTSIGRPDK